MYVFCDLFLPQAPKDRLCRQALGPELSAEAVASLLPLAKELLQFLLDINVESSSFNMKRYKYGKQCVEVLIIGIIDQGFITAYADKLRLGRFNY